MIVIKPGVNRLREGKTVLGKNGFGRGTALAVPFRFQKNAGL